MRLHYFLSISWNIENKSLSKNKEKGRKREGERERTIERRNKNACMNLNHLLRADTVIARRRSPILSDFSVNGTNPRGCKKDGNDFPYCSRFDTRLTMLTSCNSHYNGNVCHQPIESRCIKSRWNSERAEQTSLAKTLTSVIPFHVKYRFLLLYPFQNIGCKPDSRNRFPDSWENKIRFFENPPIIKCPVIFARLDRTL